MFKRENFLVFGAPQIHDDEVAEVVKVIKSGWLGSGPKVSQFEKDFRNYKAEGHAVAVNSCTAALHLSLLASDVGPGDEVITTSMTFCATVNAIMHTGATPVFCDVNLDTMNIDPNEIEKKITPKTKALVIVHFAGRSCEMNKIVEITKKYNLKLIEDCAHAIETEYEGKKAGTFGDFGCFSFYVTKNMTTGEGGMVLAKTSEDADRIKILALHGMTKDAWKRFSDEGFKHYLVTECGFKYNMMDIQAALGIHQLKRVEDNWRIRQDNFNYYNELLKDFPIKLPSRSMNNERHGYHLYTIMVDEKKAGISRDIFLQEMAKRNIGVGVHYLSILEHPVYQQKLGVSPKDCPNALKIGRETLSLPLSAITGKKDLDDVISAIDDILK